MPIKDITRVFENISFRDAEVAALCALGYSTAEIGHELRIAPSTVYDHIGNVCAEIGGQGRYDVARFWRDHGEAYLSWYIARARKRLRMDNSA